MNKTDVMRDGKVRIEMYVPEQGPEIKRWLKACNSFPVSLVLLKIMIIEHCTNFMGNQIIYTH
jgi:hypothetical protein